MVSETEREAGMTPQDADRPGTPRPLLGPRLRRRLLARGLAPLRRLYRALAGFLKGFMPKSLFGRTLIILLTPLVLSNAVVTYVFFERHWDTVTRRLSSSVAGDIALILDVYQRQPGQESIESINRLFRPTTELSVALLPDATLPQTQPASFFSVLDRTLRRELGTKIERPFWFDTTDYPNHVDIRVAVDEGVLRIIAERERVFATNGHIFIFFMVMSSLVLLTVAVIYLRNQVRPIQRLARAAESFGKGRDVPDFRPAGASEVRAAAQAFLKMRERIERHIKQRTEMLAGVSHDLRTPLTRLKLELALMPETPERDAMHADVEEMERMLSEYLAFARGQGVEAAEATDLSAYLEEIAADHARHGAALTRKIPKGLRVPVRRNAFRRMVVNLLDNAETYGDAVRLSARRTRSGIEIAVEDDGPGIPPEKREEAFRPFHRLDEARSPDRSGVGLGLAIARDIARGHGGDLELGKSDTLGGLKATVRLPV